MLSVRSKILCNVTVSWFYLPDTVTHPSSLITWGWGLSFFRTSSSDNKSFFSTTVPLPRFFMQEKKNRHKIKQAFQKCYVCLILWENVHEFRELKEFYASRIPCSIFMATVILPSLPGKFVAVPRATWPNAPPPMTFSMITFSLSTSHERVAGLSGAYSFISKLFCVSSACSLSSDLIHSRAWVVLSHDARHLYHCCLFFPLSLAS